MALTITPAAPTAPDKAAAAAISVLTCCDHRVARPVADDAGGSGGPGGVEVQAGGDSTAVRGGPAGGASPEQAPLERWQATPITITGVPGNPASEEGTVRTYGCGIWAMIPELAPGPHKVAIRGTSGNFRTSVTYDLTIAS
ncbi:hypothetical protein [Actinomadura sp.]|uniref:hypothetical protein n=1 Tax=Actinomadura sp. TaxID=1989 RepID=UPI0037C73AEF